VPYGEVRPGERGGFTCLIASHCAAMVYYAVAYRPQHWLISAALTVGADAVFVRTSQCRMPRDGRMGICAGCHMMEVQWQRFEYIYPLEFSSSWLIPFDSYHQAPNDIPKPLQTHLQSSFKASNPIVKMGCNDCSDASCKCAAGSCTCVCLERYG